MRTDSISSLYGLQGPFASALVDVSQDSEDGAHQRELRVAEVLRELADAGAPEDVVKRVGDCLNEPVDQPAPLARLVVATQEGICLDDMLQERVDIPVAAWSPLPDLTAWVALHDASVPFLLVVADREGSDMEVYSASTTAEPTETHSIHGEDFHIQKVKVGGWSQQRYSNSTEEVWRQNAKESADIINRYVAEGLPLVVLAGDERARGELVKALSTRAAESTVQVDAGGRGAGSSREALEEAVADVLRGEVVNRRLQTVHEYKERKGRNSSVATTVSEVLDAFVLGQVETLLLDPAKSREETVRPADHRGLTLGLEAAAEVPLDQALIAAAAATSADVVVVPGAVLGGVPAAALLRWDQSA